MRLLEQMNYFVVTVKLSYNHCSCKKKTFILKENTEVSQSKSSKSFMHTKYLFLFDIFIKSL